MASAGRGRFRTQHHTCELTRAFLLAAQGIGLPYNPDFNGASQRGVGTWQINARDGRRCSAADAFLRPAMRTGRITLKTGALVLSVLIEKGRAVGVRWREGGETREARAATEVVMAAGAIATPKILMLSGIGPAGHLKEHGIAAVVDQPAVGANLQDHTETPVVALCNGPYGYFGHDRGLRQMRNGIEYIVNRSGPVVSNGVEAGAFFDPFDLAATPSVQQFCVPSVYLDKDISDVKASHGITINSCVERPRSKRVDPAGLGGSGGAAADRSELSRRSRRTCGSRSAGCGGRGRSWRRRRSGG